MASSYRRHRQDKTVLLSCRRCTLSSWQSQTVFNTLETEQFCPVLSAVWMHLWTSLDSVSKYDVTIRNHIANWKLGRQDSVHTALRDWKNLFQNFQSPTVLTCHQFSSHRCWQCELAIRLYSIIITKFRECNDNSTWVVSTVCSLFLFSHVLSLVSTLCLEKKETNMFFVISPIKLGWFWWYIVFLDKFAAKWYKRFPLHLNNVSALPCRTLWNLKCNKHLKFHKVA